MNINKYIAQAGLASRRGADELIKAGKVKINGRMARPIDKVETGDQVVVNGQEIMPVEHKVYLAFNKPIGVISTTDQNSHNNIMDYVSYPIRVFPVGRLDVNSQGLILLTNDGDFSQNILKGKKVEKEYFVQVDKTLDEAVMAGLSNGTVVLDGYPVLPAKVKKISDRSFTITIVEGRNRQIRRMCEAFRLNVTKLERIRIGNIELKGLAEGQYIEIEPERAQALVK